MLAIVSGIQPTGNLHLGNYLGAVKNWVELQNSAPPAGGYQMYIFIADLHSLTGKLTADELRRQTIITAAELLAAGIDPNKVTFFRQSQVVGHTELAWILNCTTPVTELYRMTQYKDKSESQSQNINAGLLTYPVLQAADILMYKGALVPVGQDQVQHVELTRVVAKKFNQKYGEYFPETKSKLTNIPKVMSLLAPEKKMSKSLGLDHVIELADEPAIIEKKLKKAVTATAGGGQAPGVANLLLLLKEFGNKEMYTKFVQAEKDKTIRYGDLKKELAAALAEYFAAFRTKRAQLLKHPEELETIFRQGADRAQIVADKTMADVRKLVGLA